jgi:hypothetical protein
VELGPRGLIRVEEHYQTSVPMIYATGDVIGFPTLADAYKYAAYDGLGVWEPRGVSRVICKFDTVWMLVSS